MRRKTLPPVKREDTQSHLWPSDGSLTMGYLDGGLCGTFSCKKDADQYAQSMGLKYTHSQIVGGLLFVPLDIDNQ